MADASAAPEAKTQDLEKTPAIGVQLSTQLGPDRALNLSCWLPLDSSMKELNDTLAKFYAAADRLEARSKILVLEKTIEALENDRKDAAKHIAKIDFEKEARIATARSRGRQGEPKAPANEDEIRRAREEAVSLCTAKIAKFTADLAKLREQAYGDADSSPNLHAGASDS